MSYKRKVTLKLDASYKVKHEKYENFKESYFSESYELASQMIKEIVDADKKESEVGMNQDYTEPISNVVAFVGKRGTGKTSAMLSFCDFLKCFGRLEQDSKDPKFICRDLLQMNDKISFTVLNCIDATLIENHKDLMGAILGNMRVVIREREDKDIQSGKAQNQEIRKLKSRLGNIYSSLLPNLSQNVEDTASEILEQLSRSWNQQQAFREAVRKFNNYMVEAKYHKTRNYLVIPIDDVDMNLENGYQLLEVIRKYLMAPNVIVILATDYQQLDGLCRKVYCELLYKDNKDLKAGQLTTEYLEKMIPTGRRIFVPELYSESNLGYTMIEVENSDNRKQSIKDIVLLNVWEHSGIILNKDYEIHWLQPNSLRKLSNYINSFHYLTDYSKTDKGREAAFESNIKWLYEDIFRFLQAEECEDNRISEIIRNFWNGLPQDKVRRLIMELKDYQFRVEFIDGNYTYGSVIGALYRIQKDGRFLAAVHGVLMVLSLYMRRLIFDLEHDSECNKESNKADMIKFSQNDFWGDNDMQNILPKSSTTSEIQYIISREMKCEDFFEKIYTGGESKGEEIEIRKILMLAIQIGLQKEGDKCRGVFKFGNFVNVSFDYKNRLNEIKTIILENAILNNNQKRQIEKETQKIVDEFEEWEKKYHTTRVIPFDSVEFMLHIFEKLYGIRGAFDGIAESTVFAEMYKAKYTEALEIIEDVLKSYDEYYEGSRNKYNEFNEKEKKVLVDFTRKYYEIYADNPFVKYMAKEEERNQLLTGYIDFFANRPEKDDSKTDDQDKG